MDLILTQIFDTNPGELLKKLGKLMHLVCKYWNIPLNCKCLKSEWSLGGPPVATNGTYQKDDSDRSEVEHMGLCDKGVLRLLNPSHPDNLEIFQQQWKIGRPVIVSNMDTRLDMDLWKPKSFSRDFGGNKINLINCLTDDDVPNQEMKSFWDGFDDIKNRLKDNEGKPMLLKLKDWPANQDFFDTLPIHFADFMRALPLPVYTTREGQFNLASRLKKCSNPPDLGPKMYCAYGSACHASKGTTNLHLDMSDAVNVMVYVGTAQNHAQNHEAYRAIDEFGCDEMQRKKSGPVHCGTYLQRMTRTKFANF